jgi:mono/diheme cytochrome c family protein
MWNNVRLCGSAYVRMLRRIVPLWFFVMLLAACAGGEQTAVEFMPHMMDSPAVKAQEAPMRGTIEGTIPRGFSPYPYGIDEGELAGAALHNALPRTEANFLRGQQVFNTYCTVCHGERGKGDGSVVPKFPRPPSLLSEKIQNWSDGRLYHVITVGQNLMPGYAGKVRPADRWAVAHYVRALQRASNPQGDDMKHYKRRILHERIGRE